MKLADGIDRAAVQADMKKAGVPTAVYYPLPLHQQTAYKDYPADPAGLATSEHLSQTVLALPMHPYLEDSVQDQIAGALRAAVKG